MRGKKPSTVQGFIVVREFRGVALYLHSIHIGKGMRWLADRAKAMVISDAQDALAVSERASREWGTKAFVATTDEAPHIVERAASAPLQALRHHVSGEKAPIVEREAPDFYSEMDATESAHATEISLERGTQS